MLQVAAQGRISQQRPACWIGSLKNSRMPRRCKLCGTNTLSFCLKNLSNLQLVGF